MSNFNVFLSRKSSDAKMAKLIYDFLQSNGLNVFDSDISLAKLKKSEFQPTIDKVLDEANHLIVVGSSVDNILSDWVKSEWEIFENEKRSGRKKGNILVVISKKIKIENLPLTLRQKQVFYYEDKNFNSLLPYLIGEPLTNEKDEKVKPDFIYSKNTKLLWSASLLIPIVIGIIWMNSQKSVNQKPKPEYLDSLFVETRKKFLYEGLDKEVTFNTFKKLIESDSNFVLKTMNVYEEKANTTPILKDKYLELSFKLRIYADSVYKNH